MSILIENVLFPGTGEFIQLRIYDNGIVTVGDGEHECEIGTAKEIPPHGDLIDRNALPTSRVEWEDIVNAPTIIPAEEGE